MLCESCFDRNYTYCEGCNRVIHNDEAHYEDEYSEYPYCASCYEQRVKSAIKSYNYKPEPIFYGDGELYMGIELEIDKGGENNENADKLLNKANRDSERIYCKHDGSICEGFEIVSHPMSLEYHLNEMNWKEIMDEAIALGYRSHQTSTCGLHIHIGRRGLSKSYDEQEQIIARIVHFVELHWNELLKFSRRTEENINRWASRYGIAENTEETYYKAKNRHLGRYAAINLENTDTIEWRLFRGTLRYKSLVAAIQLVYEITRCAIMLSDREMEGLSWSEFVLKIPPDKTELIEYLKSKRLYVNEIEEEREEV